MHDILITGGTGYLGRALTRALVGRGHRVRVLARASSTQRVVDGAALVVGDALCAESVRAAVRPGEVVVHLVGTPHPGPGKGAEFHCVDLASIRATVGAVASAPIRHLVYVSVAQPAPIMRDYVAVRSEGERLIRDAGVGAVILRPWYVLGPGHQWPRVLLPLYAIAAHLPALRGGAARLGLVTLEQMTRALVHAAEMNVGRGAREVLTVPEIRSLGAASPAIGRSA